MKPKRPKSERTRFIFLLELAIVLPAAALVVLGALHLRSIQRDRSVEAAIQRDFSQVLTISAKHMNQKARGLIEDVRQHFPEPQQACAPALDKLLTEYPYIAHVFIYTSDKSLLVRSQPKRLQDAGFRDEATDFAKTIPMLVMNYSSTVEEMTKNEAKGSYHYSTTNWAVRGNERMIYQPVDMFLLTDKRNGAKVLAGLGFDADYIKGTFLPQMLDEIVSQNRSEAQSEKDHVVAMVRLRNHDEPLVASAG